MDHPLIDLINARIAKAAEDGAFDNLEGAGKPLPPVEDPENDLLNRVVRENGGVPEAVSLTRRLADLREELLGTGDRTKRRALIADMSLMEARLELLRREGRQG